MTIIHFLKVEHFGFILSLLSLRAGFGLAVLICLQGCCSHRPPATAEGQAQFIQLHSDGAASTNLSETVSTIRDEVYGTSKRYRGIGFSRYIQARGFRLTEMDTQTVVQFVCNDGYAPVAALRELVDDGAFLAAGDLDAPSDRTWISFPQAHTSRDPGPFYLIWPQDRFRRDDHPWPYGITAIRLGSIQEVLGPAVPRSTRFQQGFDLFRRNCIMCHSLNGRGGTIGIELNDPRNVFEYWQSDKLPEFVSRPESFRRNTKMPAFEQLGSESIAAILAYIKHMKDHKITRAP